MFVHRFVSILDTLLILTLTNLSIGGNKIGNEGAKYLSDALKNNRVGDCSSLIFFRLSIFIQTLTTLDFWGSRIGHEVAQYLGDALKHNSVCDCLDIKFFQFRLLCLFIDTHYAGAQG